MDDRPTSARRLLRWAIAVLAACVFAASGSTPAHAADNTLVSTSPADGSTVETSPTTMLLTFANQLGRTNTVSAACNGTIVALGTPQLTPDALSLSVSVPTPMPKGTCAVSWRVSQPDGTPGGQGSFSFTITADAAVTVAPPADTSGGTSGGTASDSTTAPATTPASNGSGSAGAASDGGGGSVSGPLGLARLLTNLGLAVLFGSLVLIALAWPEGVEYILTVRFLRTACIVSIVGAAFTVVALTAQVTGKGIGATLSPSTWSDLTDSTPGLAALARLGLSVASIWVVMRPERVIDPANQVPALALPGLAVATLGFSRTGGELAAVGVAVGVLHALAMAVWLGGLVLLVRVVLAGSGDDDLVHAVRGFVRISTPAILVTVLTGAVQTFRLDRGTLFQTGHGWVMLLKAVAVGAMVFVGLAARQFIQSRLGRADSLSAPMAFRVRRALGIEAIGGVLVLTLTAWLLSLTPGTFTPTDTTTRGLGSALLINNTDVGAEVTVAFSQIVGRNGVRVEVIRPETGLSGLTVEFVPPPNSGAAGVVLNVPLTGAGVAVLPQSDGLPIGAPGSWTVTVRIGDTPVGSKTALVLDTGAASG
jgi:copper transport protein